MSCFELHSSNAVDVADLPGDTMPWDIGPAADDAMASNGVNVFSIGKQDGPVWVHFDPVTGRLCRAASRLAALAELQVISRRGGELLTLLPLASDILVNAEVVDDLRVLNVRDSIVLSPGGSFSQVTERFAPYVGPPTEDMLKRKLTCPMCRLPFDADTQVLTCRCGCVMHYETAESHPAVVESDRLECATRKLANCLSCGRVLQFEPFLVWDPSAPSNL